MFNFRTLDFGFWRDMRNDGMSFDYQALLVWLITNEWSHYSGLYYLPKHLISLEVDLPDVLVKLMPGLIEKNYIAYDENTSEIWVVNMAKYQIRTGNAYNVLLGLNKHLRTVKSPALVHGFLEKYKGLKATNKQGRTITLEGPENIKSLDSVNPAAPMSKFTPPPPKTTTKAKPRPKPKEDPAIYARFDKFWEIWPRRDAKADALKAWKSLNPDDELTEIVLQKLGAITKALDWERKAAGSDRQFVPLPATWLRGRRWEDDLPTTVSNSNLVSAAKTCTAENPMPLDLENWQGKWKHPQATLHIGKDNIRMAVCPHCGVRFKG